MPCCKPLYHCQHCQDCPTTPGLGFQDWLVPDFVHSCTRTGFRHNGVSPIGLATPLPIILSHRIAELPENNIWLGAGEPNLKLGMPVDRFIEAYAPLIVDCTDDKRTMTE